MTIQTPAQKTAPTLAQLALSDDGPDDRCTNPGGHEYECTGTAYGGDDESYFGEGRCYCIWCGADGDG